MPFTFACLKCSTEITAPDDRAGGGMRCDICGQITQVPPASGAAVPVTDLFPVPEAEAEPDATPVPKARRKSEPVSEPDADERPWADLDKPRKRKRKRGRSWYWVPFAGGCRLAKTGIAVELGGVALMLLLLEVIVLARTGVFGMPNELESGGLVLFPATALLVGSCLLAVGRTKQARLPRGTIGAGVFVVAAWLGWLRFVLILISTSALAKGIGEYGALGGNYFLWSLRAYALALLVGTVAELSAVPGMALIGAEMPSRVLLDRAASTAFAIQLLAAVWVVLVIGYTYFDVLGEPPSRTPSRSDTRPRQTVGADGRTEFTTLILMVLFLLQAGYSYLHYSLYSVGQFAGEATTDRC